MRQLKIIKTTRQLKSKRELRSGKLSDYGI